MWNYVLAWYQIVILFVSVLFLAYLCSFKPVDEQTEFILCALWIGLCFFLQRIFEKLFKDQGYAFLTVFTIGLLIASFTASDYLLGGSIVGTVAGSRGDRA